VSRVVREVLPNLHLKKKKKKVEKRQTVFCLHIRLFNYRVYGQNKKIRHKIAKIQGYEEKPGR
jgi:hypothetical protein